MVGTVLGEIEYKGDLEHLLNQYAGNFMEREKPSVWNHIQRAFTIDENVVKFDFTKIGKLTSKTEDQIKAGNFYQTPDGKKAVGYKAIHISHIFIKSMSFIVFSRIYNVYLLAPKGCFTKKATIKAYQSKTVEEEVRLRSIASVKRDEDIEHYSTVTPGCFGTTVKRYQKPTSFIRIRGADIYDIHGDDTNEMDAAIKQMNSALDRHEVGGHGGQPMGYPMGYPTGYPPAYGPPPVPPQSSF